MMNKEFLVTLEQPAERVAFEMRWLVEHGYSTPMGGNVSWRLNEETMLVTPSHVDKRFLLAADLVRVNIESGEYVAQKTNRKPSSEAIMHRAIFQARPDIRSIVHAHPRNTVYASGIPGNILQEALNKMIGFIPEYAVNYFPDRVRVTDSFQMMWSEDLGRQVAGLFEEGASAVIMRNHGPITVGENMSDGMEKLLLLEELVAMTLMRIRDGDQAIDLAMIPDECLTEMDAAMTSFAADIRDSNR